MRGLPNFHTFVGTFQDLLSNTPVQSPVGSQQVATSGFKFLGCLVQNCFGLYQYRFKIYCSSSFFLLKQGVLLLLLSFYLFGFRGTPGFGQVGTVHHVVFLTIVPPQTSGVFTLQLFLDSGSCVKT